MKFQVLGVWYGRTVIRSAYKLSYEVAQDILDGKSETELKNEIAELVTSECFFVTSLILTSSFSISARKYFYCFKTLKISVFIIKKRDN